MKLKKENYNLRNYLTSMNYRALSFPCYIIVENSLLVMGFRVHNSKVLNNLPMGPNRNKLARLTFLRFLTRIKKIKTKMQERRK